MTIRRPKVIAQIVGIHEASQKTLYTIAIMLYCWIWNFGLAIQIAENMTLKGGCARPNG